MGRFLAEAATLTRAEGLGRVVARGCCWLGERGDMGVVFGMRIGA